MIHTLILWAVDVEVLKWLQPTVIVLAVFGWGIRVERSIARMEVIVQQIARLGKCPLIQQQGE